MRATAAVMAKLLPQLEVAHSSLVEQLHQREADLQAAMAASQLEELSRPLVAMQRSFATGNATPEQRRAVTGVLRKLNRRILVRGSSQESS